MCTSFFKVKFLRALKGVHEGPFSNSSKVFMRPISIPYTESGTSILKDLLCSQGFISKGLKGPQKCS